MKKLIFALFAILLCSGGAMAAPIPGADADIPVDVTADNMEYRADNSTVIFRGKVEAIRGDFKMWSETLTLVLKGEKKDGEQDAKEKKASQNGDLDRIIAEHNVRFQNGSQNGTAQKATFLARQNILVLEGDPVLNDGENSIRGNVIRYFINENRSVVEGSPKKRVHAVFSNENKGK